MPRRHQVQYRAPQQGVEPIASPQSRPFVPRLPPDVMLPVDALAGLSQTLAQISAQQAEKDFDEKRQIGLDAAAGAPTDVIDALAAAHRDQDGVDARNRAVQEAMAKAVREGKIHVSQDPAVHVGFVQGAAHRLMAGYDAKLAEQMAAATATTDANGDPVVARSPDELIREVWGQYKDNPILQNYYGSKVAQQMKSQADAGFTEAAARKLGENRVHDTINWSTNALTEKFFALGVSGEDPTPATWESVRAWADELYLKTGGKADRKKIMVQALRGAASRMDAADSGDGVSKAAELLRDLRGAPVGSTTIGKDAVAGPELEALIDQYEQNHKTKAQNLGAAEAAADNRAVNTGEREFLQIVDEAGPGADLVALAEQYKSANREDAKFADRTGLVNAAIDKLAVERDAAAGALYAAQLERQLADGEDPESVSRQAGALPLDVRSRKRVQDAIEERASLRPLIEDSPISRKNELQMQNAAQIPGIPEGLRGELGVEVTAQNQAILDEYHDSEAAGMKGLLALPPEQRDAAQRHWYAESAPEFKKRLIDLGTNFSTLRASALSKADDLLARSSSPEPVIKEFAKYLSTNEIRQMRDRAIVATDRTAMMDGNEYKDTESFGVDTILNKPEFKDSPNKPAIIEAFRRELRSQFVPAIDAVLPTVEPNAQRGAIRKVLEEIIDPVLERVASSPVARLTEAAKPGGEGVEAGLAILDRAADDLELAQSVLGLDPHDAANALSQPVNPNVSKDLVELQQGLLGGKRWFGKVRAAAVLDRGYSEFQRALSNPKLSDQDRAQLAVDARRGTVIPADQILAGKLTVSPSAEWRANAAEVARIRKAQGEAFRGTGLRDTASVSATSAALEAALARPDPVVDLKGASIPPYTTAFFPTSEGRAQGLTGIAEFQTWVNTREPELLALAKKLGVPPGEEAFGEWVRQQTKAITRIANE